MNPKTLIRTAKNYFHFLFALFAQIYWGYPAKKLFIIAITGTDGKTTTSTLIYHILKSANLNVGLVSTVAAYLGDKEVDTGFHVTSPGSWQQQQIMNAMVKQGITYAVLEITSHGIDQHRMLGISPVIAAITNVTHEHLDYHHNLEVYKATKLRLLQMANTALINLDEPTTKFALKALAVKPTTTSFSALPRSVQTAITKRFCENYNHRNATLASQTCLLLGVDEKTISTSISSFPQISGRMNFIPNKTNRQIVVDFAHTPNALKQSLVALKPQTKGKIIAVFGSAGLRDRTKRPLMGKNASLYADEIILTAEDPRTESVDAINDDIISGITTMRGHVHRQNDRYRAIKMAISLSKPGDIIGIFGKGHEKSMCFGKIEHPWSDTKAVKKALKELSL